MSHYLVRIQTLRIEAFDAREHALWQALSMFIPFGPLCPNLRELYLNFDGLKISEAHYFTPLLTSSLRSISIYDPDYSHTGEMAACLILDTLRFRNAKMSSISYRGQTSNRILKRITSFSTLHSISIPLCTSKGECKRNMASCLTRNLTNLDINVNHFSDNILQKVEKQFERLVSLTSLTLRGALNTIHKCIHGLDPIASISSFGLCRDPPSPYSDVRIDGLIPSLTSVFPNLHSLHLENVGTDISMVTLNDLISFQERPIRALGLINCFNTLWLTDYIKAILEVWPTLEHLWFEGNSLSAKKLLPLISCSAPSLQDLTFPLRFPDVWDVSVENEVVCPLQYLRIPPPVELNFDCPEAFRHVHGLKKLFPGLRVISERTKITWKFATIDFAIKDINFSEGMYMENKMWKARLSSNVPQRCKW